MSTGELCAKIYVGINIHECFECCLSYIMEILRLRISFLHLVKKAWEAGAGFESSIYQLVHISDNK